MNWPAGGAGWADPLQVPAAAGGTGEDADGAEPQTSSHRAGEGSQYQCQEL